MGLDVANLERKQNFMFEGNESSISDVKLPFLGKLYDWIAYIQKSYKSCRHSPFSNTLELLELPNFKS